MRQRLQVSHILPLLLRLLITLEPAISEAQVKKTLADNEAARLAAGGLILYATSASSFLIVGLELEDVQYVNVASHLMTY